MAAASAESPLLKQLASSHKKTRDDALESLRTYLRSRKIFNEVELLKLWKGLFYCMWMSDKPLVQQRLAVDMGNLVAILPRDIVLPFLDAFWKTMAREWVGIDALRMNKFLFLVRQYLAASFRHFEQGNWRDTARLEEYLEILSETPLNPTNPKLPNGLRYHLLDIYVDEIDKLDTSQDSEIPWKKLLQPVKKLQAESPTKSVRARATETLQDERLKAWEAQDEDGGMNPTALGGNSRPQDSEGEEEEEDDEWNGFDD